MSANKPMAWTTATAVRGIAESTPKKAGVPPQSAEELAGLSAGQVGKP